MTPMLKLEDVEARIRELEAREDTALAQMQNLAWLYVVRDHLEGAQDRERKTEAEGVAAGANPEAFVSGEQPSEFWTYARNLKAEELFRVFEQWAEELQVVYPKAYDRLIEMLKGQ